jgi:multiple sugar transport system permease protein
VIVDAVIGRTRRQVMRPPGHRRTARRVPIWLLVPSFVVMALVAYIPLVIAIIISFTTLSQYTIGDIGRASMVGLRNFVDVLDPSGPLQVLRPLANSALISVLTAALAVPIGIGGALLVNQRFRGRTLMRTVMLLPFILPHFVTALIWRLLFQSGTGAIDQSLRALHLGSGYHLWLIGSLSFPALLIAAVWVSWPFVYIMVLAGLQSIPAEYYDAAEVDGAGPVRRFWSVTLPSIAPTLALAVCLSVINQFNNFTLPFIMLGNPPPAAANVLPIEIYRVSVTSSDFGHASAIAVVNLLVLLIPVVYYLRRAGSE